MTAEKQKWRFRSPRNNIICQQLVFWLSSAALATAIYDLTQAFEDDNLKASAILIVVSAISSLGYLYLHWLISRQYLENDDSDLPFKKPSHVAVRVAAVAPVFWLLTAAWGLVLSARRSVCLSRSAISKVGQWQAGNACIAHRAGVAVSLLAFIVSCLFFAMIATDHHCFETHLLGHRKVQQDDDKPLSKCIQSFKTDAAIASHSRNASAQSTTTLPRYVATPPQRLRAVPALQHQPYAQAPPSYRTYSPQPSCRTSTMNSNTPYMHSRSQSLTSLRSVQYYQPMQPAPVLMADSAWRAIHPPAYQFRHVAQPYRPQTPNSMLRQIPPSPSYMRTHALYSASASSHSSRSHSRAGSMNRMYYAPNGQRLRSSPSSQSLSTRSASSGSSGGRVGQPSSGSLARVPVYAHQRSASDVSGSASLPIANSMPPTRGLPALRHAVPPPPVRRMASDGQIRPPLAARGALHPSGVAKKDPGRMVV